MKTEKTACAINDQCINTFFSKETFNTVSKISVPFVTAFVLAVIAYGFAYADHMLKIESRVAIIENRQMRLDSMVNTKLDILIERSK